jgi:hypothetical protein
MKAGLECSLALLVGGVDVLGEAGQVRFDDLELAVVVVHGAP